MRQLLNKNGADKTFCKIRYFISILVNIQYFLNYLLHFGVYILNGEKYHSCNV